MTAAALALALIPVISAGYVHGPVSLPTYQQAVHTVRLQLDRAGPSPEQAVLSRARQELSALRAVRLTNGHVIVTDLPSLADQLRRSDTRSVGRVRKLVDTLDSSLSALQPRQANPAQLRALDAVLRESQFHPVRPPWAPLIDWLREQHDRFLEWLNGAVSARSPSSMGFAAVLVVLVAGLGYLLARGALSRLVVERRPPEDLTAPTTSADAEDRVAGQVAAGNYRDALRYLFLATMLALQERGAIELRPGVTNREYLRRLREGGMPSGVSHALGELVDAFDAVWYGHVAIDAGDFRRYQELSRLVLMDAPVEAA